MYLIVIFSFLSVCFVADCSCISNSVDVAGVARVPGEHSWVVNGAVVTLRDATHVVDDSSAHGWHYVCNATGRLELKHTDSGRLISVLSGDCFSMSVANNSVLVLARHRRSVYVHSRATPWVILDELAWVVDETLRPETVSWIKPGILWAVTRSNVAMLVPVGRTASERASFAPWPPCEVVYVMFWQTSIVCIKTDRGVNMAVCVSTAEIARLNAPY